MNVSPYLDQNIEAVRFTATGNILTVYQFAAWLKLNTSVSSDDVLGAISAANAEPVYKLEPPSVSENQFAEWDGAVQIDGLWYRNWKIVDAPHKQEMVLANKLADLRRERNALLVASDWTQFSDSPLANEKRAEWALYRQQLRDITKQDINAIVWPVPPSA